MPQVSPSRGTAESRRARDGPRTTWHHRDVTPVGPLPAWRPSPHRVTTDRLVLCSYEHTDALDVHEAVTANATRLRAFMAWTHDRPETVAERRDKLAHFRREFDQGRGTNDGVFDGAGSDFVGGLSLPTGQDRTVLELGYWLTAESEGKRFASAPRPRLQDADGRALEWPP